jgi:hypothetical protein
MKKWIPLVVVPGIALTACLQDDETRYTYGRAAVDSVRVLSTSAPVVEFMVFGGFPTPCWEFSEAHVTFTSRATCSVSLDGRVQRDRACIALWAPFERRVPVEVPTPGEYRFDFLGDPSAPVSVTVRVE